MQCLSSQNNGIEISTGEHADQIGWQFSVCFCRFFFFCFGSILFLSQTLQKLLSNELIADETEKKSLFKKLAASLTRKDGPK